ncbi:MAG: hypothetical protein HQL40_20890, partial [Alphaproteobacteria bacterium]|nr:hypothetical protein [Alphaproteobacteria bacterium]
MSGSSLSLAGFAGRLPDVRAATLRDAGLLHRAVRVTAAAEIGGFTVREGQTGVIDLGPVPSPSLFAAAREAPVALKDGPIPCLGIPWGLLELVPPASVGREAAACAHLPRLIRLMSLFAPMRGGGHPVPGPALPPDPEGPLVVIPWRGEGAGLPHLAFDRAWSAADAIGAAMRLAGPLAATHWDEARGELVAETPRVIANRHLWLKAQIDFGTRFVVAGGLVWP